MSVEILSTDAQLYEKYNLKMLAIGMTDPDHVPSGMVCHACAD